MTHLSINHDNFETVSLRVGEAVSLTTEEASKALVCRVKAGVEPETLMQVEASQTHLFGPYTEVTTISITMLSGDATIGPVGPADCECDDEELPADQAIVTDGTTTPILHAAGATVMFDAAISVADSDATFRAPASVAAVTNGDTITATGGQTIDVTVADGVASMTVESNEPLWNPFTVTAGEVDGRGYERGVAGSITNEPVDGYSVYEARTYGGDFRFVIEGPQPLASDGLLNALVGINSNDYSLVSVTSYCSAGGIWSTTLEARDVPVWTVDQQVPIVIIPQ